MVEKKRRVFLVEDEVLVAFEMAETLRDMGHEVVGPSVRFKDAQDKANTADIDFALLDVNLGKGQTSEPIAKILRKRGIPVIFMTAYDRDHVSFMHDDEDIVIKPVDAQRLEEALARAISPSEN